MARPASAGLSGRSEGESWIQHVFQQGPAQRALESGLVRVWQGRMRAEKRTRIEPLVSDFPPSRHDTPPPGPLHFDAPEGAEVADEAVPESIGRRAVAGLRDLAIALLVLAALWLLLDKRTRDTGRWWRARVAGSFVPTPAVVLGSGVEHFRRQVHNTWVSGSSPWIRFSWEAEGRRRERVEELEASQDAGGEAGLSELRRRYPAGLEIEVQVDPEDADFAVYDLEAAVPSGVSIFFGLCFGLLLGIPGLCLAGWLVVNAAARFVRRKPSSESS